VGQQAYTHVCSGASSVYASCKEVGERICGKIYVLSLDLSKKGLISLHRKMEKRPFVTDRNGEANLAITTIRNNNTNHNDIYRLSYRISYGYHNNV
jgi:hypothetical protein